MPDWTACKESTAYCCKHSCSLALEMGKNYVFLALLTGARIGITPEDSDDSTINLVRNLSPFALAVCWFLGLERGKHMCYLLPMVYTAYFFGPIKDFIVTLPEGLVQSGCSLCAMVYVIYITVPVTDFFGSLHAWMLLMLCVPMWWVDEPVMSSSAEEFEGVSVSNGVISCILFFVNGMAAHEHRLWEVKDAGHEAVESLSLVCVLSGALAAMFAVAASHGTLASLINEIALLILAVSAVFRHVTLHRKIYGFDYDASTRQFVQAYSSKSLLGGDSVRPRELSSEGLSPARLSGGDLTRSLKDTSPAKIRSDEVEKKPFLCSSLCQLASSYSKQDLKASLNNVYAAMSSWRTKHWFSLIAACAVFASMMACVFDYDYYRGMFFINASAAAKIGAALSATLAFTSGCSLLTDSGHLEFSIDVNFKLVVILEAFIYVLIVVVLVTPKNSHMREVSEVYDSSVLDATGTRDFIDKYFRELCTGDEIPLLGFADDSKNFQVYCLDTDPEHPWQRELLVKSSIFFIVSMFILTFKLKAWIEFLCPAEEQRTILRQKGRPRFISIGYFISQVSYTAGCVLLIGRAWKGTAEVLFSEEGVKEFGQDFRSKSLFKAGGFALTFLLTHEAARLLEDPGICYCAARTADGVRRMSGPILGALILLVPDPELTGTYFCWLGCQSGIFLLSLGVLPSLTNGGLAIVVFISILFLRFLFPVV